METLLFVLEKFALPTASALVTWLLAKRKYNAEVDKNLISNMEESLNFYKHIVDDNKARLKEYEDENRRLREKLKETSVEVRQLREQVDYLMRYVCTDIACKSRASDMKKVRTKKKVTHEVDSK